MQIVNTLAVADGGPARNSFELNQSLNALEGFTAMIVSMRSGVPSVPEIDGANGRTIIGPSPRHLGTRTEERSISLLRLLAEIRSCDIVLLHGYYLWWAPIMTVLSRMLRVRVAITPHGSLTAYDRGRKTLRKTLFDLLTRVTSDRLVAIFITGSERERRELLEARPSAMVAVGGVGVSYSSSARPAQAPQSTSSLRLVTVSRIAPKKRIDLMIDCVAAAIERGLDVELVVAGSGDRTLEEALAEQTVRQGVASRVKFVGHVAGVEKDALYRSSHIFLMPSDDENFGIALAEALSAGLPSIVSANVGAADGLDPAAIVVLDDRSGSAIAAAIEPLKDPFRWSMASKAALDTAGATFDWSSVAAQWAAALRGDRTRS